MTIAPSDKYLTRPSHFFSLVTTRSSWIDSELDLVAHARRTDQIINATLPWKVRTRWHMYIPRNGSTSFAWCHSKRLTGGSGISQHHKLHLIHEIPLRDIRKDLAVWDAETRWMLRFDSQWIIWRTSKYMYCTLQKKAGMDSTPCDTYINLIVLILILTFHPVYLHQHYHSKDLKWY